MTPHIVANEVRLMRTHHKGALVIAEGPSDKNALRSLLDPEACRIVIAHGKHNATVAMQLLENEGFPGVLAVVDADFTRVEEAPIGSENVLATDLHDLECMMITSPAFEKVVGEYAESPRVEAFEKRQGCTLPTVLARSAMTIGYLRWLSIREDLSLTFEGLPFVRFLAREDLRVDLSALLVAVKNRSQRHDLDDAEIASGMESLRSPGHDPWQVSCGPDVLEILSFCLQRTIGARKQSEVKPEALARGLRLAYDTAHFQETALYQSMRTWESAHPSYRLLRA